MVSLAFLTLAISVAAAPATMNRLAADAVFDSPDYAKWVENAKPGDIYKYDGGAITLDNKKTKPSNSGNSTHESRAGVCITYYGLQSNVDATDLWWDAWGPIAECKWCGGGPCTATWQWEWKTTWRVSGDWDESGWKAVRDTINKDGHKNKGHRWAKEAYTTGTQNCPANAGEPVRLWRQNRFGWADIAQRTIINHVCPFHRITYGDWKFSHLDLPLEGNDGTYVLGCSNGDRAECERNI
ncbi:hypothetical protein CspHIS471_0705230 [Cutaneotrichosporon sp. HIS471]|nr:hypothetical protein CspHIS471_0705230 [Cutaneotrichosporon sp. HIS471]